MIVFGLDNRGNEYAFRFDVPYDPGRDCCLIKSGICSIRMRGLLSDRVNGEKDGKLSDVPGTCRGGTIFVGGKSTSPDIPFTDLIIMSCMCGDLRNIPHPA